MVELPYKIHIPHSTPELVSRPRLSNLIQTVERRKLMALVAPAGYGKTSLLIEMAHRAALPVCWYSLDVYDADPWEFLPYLTASVEVRFPHSMGRTRLLFGSMGQTLQTIAATFISCVNEIPGELIFCLDDWHFVDQVEPIKKLLEDIIARCPRVHLLLASRAHPSLSNQMLLAARRQFFTVNESQLRFSAQEIGEVLEREGVTGLSSDEARWLVEQSDGWLAGVLLAFQATGGNIQAMLASRSVLSRTAEGFLAEQVLNQQPPELQTFLCESSMLEELTPQQCDVLLGRSDSAVVLEQLLTARLFIREMAPGMLRYHPLFRECLQRNLLLRSPLRFQRLGLQIAHSYARQGQWSMAIELCLSWGDLPAALELVRSSGEELYLQGRLETLEHIFAMLPTDRLDIPLLCLKARLEIDRSRYQQAELLVGLALGRAGAVTPPEVLLLQVVLNRIAGRYELGRAQVEQVLEAEISDAMRGTALRILGSIQHRQGQTLAAITTLQRAREFEERRGSIVSVALVEHELMICYHAIGALSDAAAVGHHAETCWSIVGNLGRRALTRNSLALNQLISGQYKTAYATLGEALRDAQDAATPQYEAAILSTLGDLYATLGLWDQAEQTYRKALEKGPTAFISGHIAVSQIEVLLGRGNHAVAARAIERLPERVVQQQQGAVLLMGARLAGTSGGVALAEQALERSAANSALTAQLRCLITLAWLHGLGDPTDDTLTVEFLGRAARLAEQSGLHAVAVAMCLLHQIPLEQMRARLPYAEEWQELIADLRGSAEALAEQPARTQAVGMVPAVSAPAKGSAPLLRVHYLGGDQVWLAGQPIVLSAGRVRNLLAYLITHPGGATRPELYRAVWCNDESPEGIKALNQAIYRLRSFLPDQAIATINRDTYRLDRSVLPIESDVELFEQAYTAALRDQPPERREASIGQALRLYHGPFLGEADIPWAVELRARLARHYHQLLLLAAEQSERRSAFHQALELYHRILSGEATSVAAHTGIMRCHVALREPAQAIGRYRSLIQILDEELGIELDPRSEAERIYQELLAG